MLSRRGHRLSRFRKNKRRLRERLRQRIFFRDKVVPEAMEKPRVLVLTGAGISAESGIRTFRAADGLWEEHRVEDVATPEGFDRDPELVQAFYNARRRQLQQPEIQPNAAHLALAKLQDALGDRFLLVTQNIDNLHERAGNTNVIHMHGELLKVVVRKWSGSRLDWRRYARKIPLLPVPGTLAPRTSFGLAKCHSAWMKFIWRCRWLIFSLPLVLGMFIRRLVCSRANCMAHTPWN